MPTRPHDHFSPIADAYTRGRFGYPPALFDCLTGLCATRDLAWDCATGSGQAVPELARRFKGVVATDISQELLNRAPALANITYVRAPAEQSTLAEASVDLVTVAQAIHWFNLDAFWTEVRRVVKPGGVLAFWAYTWPMVDREVDAIFASLRTEIAPYWPRGIELVHDEYRSITPPFAPVPTPAFEIQATWPRANYLAHIGSWSAIRYYREQRGRDPIPAFDAQLAAAWPDGDARSVRWSIHLKAFHC